MKVGVASDLLELNVLLFAHEITYSTHLLSLSLISARSHGIPLTVVHVFDLQRSRELASIR